MKQKISAPECGEKTKAMSMFRIACRKEFVNGFDVSTGKKKLE